MSSRSYQKLMALLFLSLVVLIVVATVTLTIGIRLPDADNWVQHTQKVQVAIETFSNDYQSAEASARGYTVTGDDSYLQAYYAEVDSCGIDLQSIQDMTADNQVQQENIIKIRPYLASRLKQLSFGIEMRREKGINGVLGLINQSRAKSVRMQNELLLSGIKSMNDEETRMLTIRTERLKSESRIVSQCVILIVVILSIFLTVCLIIAWRGYNDAIRIEIALKGFDPNIGKLTE